MSAISMNSEMTATGAVPAHPDQASLIDSLRVRLVFCLAVTLFITVQLCLYADRFLQDPDNWWQVKVGLDLLANRAVPTVDPYSYTFAGEPWIAKEWLGQVFLATAFTLFGWPGVAFLTIATAALAMGLLAWILSDALKPIIAIIVTLMVTIAVGSIYNARPLIFSFPIIIVWTSVLFRAAREERPPPVWALALIALWANLHGTFTFGFVIAAFAGLDCLSRVRLSQPFVIAKWIAFGLGCVLVTMINPYGFQAILATFSVASGNEAVPLIQEWQPFNARTDRFSEVVLLLAFCGALLSGLRIRWTYAAFFAFTLHLFLAYGRFQYLWVMLVPIVLAPDIAAQFPALSKRRWLSAPRERLEKVMIRRALPISATIGALWLAWAASFLGFSSVIPGNTTSASGALAYVRDQGISGNVLNSYDFGGTLIFHDIKTYIDGRTDQLFLGGFMNRTMEMGTPSGRQILEQEIAERDIRWALLTRGDDRNPVFADLPGWKKAYADDFAIVYVRNP